MLDLIQLLPHCKKDVKLDTKTDRAVINEVADMKVCATISCCEPTHTLRCGIILRWVIRRHAGEVFCLLLRAAAVSSSLRLAKRRTCTSGCPSRQMGLP